MLAQVPLAQLYVQHDALPVQAWPTSRHCCAEHLPDTHWFEQHSVPVPQVSLGPLQKVGAVQVPFWQVPEQQARPLDV
jgi:hypothetical protein